MKPRRLRASSLSASLFLHAILIAGAVLSGVFFSRSEAPRRIFDVKFDDPAPAASSIEEEREELADLEPAATSMDEEPELLPEPLRPVADPDALTDPAPEEVPQATDPLQAFSSETIFGLEPEEVQPADESDATEPATAGPVEALPEPSPEVAPEVLPADEPAHLTRTEGADPAYPKLSLRRREEGDVVLRLAIDAEGRVTLVELAESSGFRRLDQAAMSAAPTWRFSVPSSGPPESFEHTVHFRLQR